MDRRLAVLGPSGKDWTVELNLVSWNGREPKLDLRSWDPSHERMGKGIALTRDEAEKLRDALADYLAT
ncbi:MAG TPA: PC4/YdbC family ssDNA-binding protein [Spirochaetales bacterium]|nr:PC4/YdbC family ssDNA-binding protein [Spirochaetales bacterium]HPE88934.1 PC4/YdbC family ssDNA-binding protein [Spirochaetales bacterium]HQO66429.1 PC4/YdbC family ssDNA-binding protein [Spirochaetales bacterium]